MSRNTSCKSLQGPKLKYRSISCINHNQTMNNKNNNQQKQRLIPLTAELMTNNLSNYCLGDKEFIEPLSNLIKTEVSKCINDIKDNFASQADLQELTQQVTHLRLTNSSLAATSNDGSEFSPLDDSSQPRTEFELENGQINLNNNIGDTRVLDNNQFLPLELMYSSNNKEDRVANIKNMIPNYDIAGEFNLKKIKELDVRVQFVESRMAQIQTTVKKIQLVNQNDIEKLRTEQSTKINAINKEISDIHLDLDTCLNDDHSFESKLQDIEAKVKQSLYETQTQHQCNMKMSDSNYEREKTPNYDEMFYEVRQMRMNELYNKKSKKNKYLNQRPHMNQFGPPPVLIPAEEKVQPPRFVETQ